MVVECVAIVVVLLAIMLVFLRSHKKSYILAIVPLLFVPVAFLITTLLSHKLVGMPLGVFRISGTLLGLVSACLMLGILASRMKSKKRRYIYLVTSGMFLLLLTWCLIFWVVHPIW